MLGELRLPRSVVAGERTNPPIWPVTRALGVIVVAAPKRVLCVARADLRLLEGSNTARAVEAARCELAAELLEDLRRIDAQMRDVKKLTTAVGAAATTVTEVFGVGPRAIRLGWSAAVAAEYRPEAAELVVGRELPARRGLSGRLSDQEDRLDEDQ